MHAQRLGIMPKMTYACLAFCVSGERAHGLFKDHARAGNALVPAHRSQYDGRISSVLYDHDARDASYYNLTFQWAAGVLIFPHPDCTH